MFTKETHDEIAADLDRCEAKIIATQLYINTTREKYASDGEMQFQLDLEQRKLNQHLKHLIVQRNYLFSFTN